VDRLGADIQVRQVVHQVVRIVAADRTEAVDRHIGSAVRHMGTEHHTAAVLEEVHGEIVAGEDNPGEARRNHAEEAADRTDSVAVDMVNVLEEGRAVGRSLVRDIVAAYLRFVALLRPTGREWMGGKMCERGPPTLSTRRYGYLL